MRDRLPSRNRIPDVDTLFYDDYRLAHKQNFETLALASGQTIYILRGKKTPQSTIDTSGTRGRRDEFGARRISNPEVVTSKQQTTGVSQSEIHPAWKRSTDGLFESCGIPVLVESARLAKIVNASGKDFYGDWIIHVPLLFLERNNLEFIPEVDYISYQKINYIPSQVQDYGYICDTSAEIIFGLKKVTA